MVPFLFASWILQQFLLGDCSKHKTISISVANSHFHSTLCQIKRAHTNKRKWQHLGFWIREIWNYLVPQIWVGFLINHYQFDLTRILHFPLAIRIWLNPYISTCSLICIFVIYCIRQVINKWLLTNISADRACVEWISSVIGSLVPI